ncbi:MAG: hypothetical protein J7L77_10295 [Clostridiales bacterium]|nr:hypothetical protein [Clostridiales bacterium]
MNKKLVMITVIVAVVVMAVAGTALAYNGNGSKDGSAQRFTASVEDFETVEDFHAAVLAEKMAIIETKIADGSMTQEEADALIEYLTSCDEDCTLDGENPNRPEEGWGIFGRGTGDGVGVGEGNGYKGGNEDKGTGNRARLAECDEDGEPILDGSGSTGAQGHRGGRD